MIRTITVSLVLLLSMNIGAQKIQVDTYNDGTRRILTKSVEVFRGCETLLDVYATKADTTYYIKLGFKNLSDSVVTGNRFVIKLNARQKLVGTELDEFGENKNIYENVGEDTVVVLTCSQATLKNKSSKIVTYPIGSIYVSQSSQTSYQVAFYEISRENLEQLIVRGNGKIRIETVNNLIEKKAIGFSETIAKLFKAVKNQLTKVNQKEHISDF